MYNVQCLASHVYEAPLGSDLEKRCIEREKRGYLDALCLSSEECLDCREEWSEHLRREARFYDDIILPEGFKLIETQ